MTLDPIYSLFAFFFIYLLNGEPGTELLKNPFLFLLQMVGQNVFLVFKYDATTAVNNAICSDVD